jgi:hypothetical protein
MERVYWISLFASILATGLLFAALAPSLPYGDAAPWVLAAACVISLAPGAAFVRATASSAALHDDRLQLLAFRDLPAKDGSTFVGFAFPWKPGHAENLQALLASGHEAPTTQELFAGNPAIHGLGASEESPLFLPDSKRTHHALVLGSPGEGKTRFLELLARQLIAKGDIVAIVDPKGDARLIDAVRLACAEAGRGDDFRLVAIPWPGASAAYNPLASFGTVTELADRLVGLLPAATGDSEAFRGFQWGATAAIVQGLFLAGLPLTIARVLRYLRDPAALVMELKDHRFPGMPGATVGEFASAYEASVASEEIARVRELDDLFQYVKLSPDYYAKMLGSFVPQLERLSAGPRREILSPEPTETDREVLSWPAIDSRGLVVYFYLGSLHGEESANALGRMLLLDLEAHLASRYSYAPEGRSRRLTLIVDEAHHLVSKPFMSVLAEARGADVAVVLSSQTTAQFEQAFGSRAAVDEILTHNFAHIQFQSRNPREAEDFSKLAGDRQMKVVAEAHRYEPAFFSSGLSSVDDFRAQHMVNIQSRESPLVPPWAICQLPSFHYFARIGGTLWKGRIPLLDAPEGGFVDALQREAAA